MTRVDNRGGKVTPAIRRRVLELGAEGKSHRQIEALLGAEGVTLSHATVGAVLRRGTKGGDDAGTGRGTARGTRGGASRGEPGEREGGGLGGIDEGDPVPGAAYEMGAPPEGASVVVVMLWEELREARAAARELRRKMIVDDDPAGPWAATVGQVRQLIKALGEAMPPKPPDPADDPHNIGARQAVYARVLQVVETAEAKYGRLCPGCGDER